MQKYKISGPSSKSQIDDRPLVLLLARISHHPSTTTALCGTPRDFHSARVLNSVSTMPAHSSVAKDTWDTTFHRLATKGGEKCGLEPVEV